LLDAYVQQYKRNQNFTEISVLYNFVPATVYPKSVCERNREE